MSPSPASTEVQAAFDALPEHAQPRLAELRALIFAVADEVDAAPLTETLKWGQPSYQSVRPRESTTIRLGVTGDGDVALFFHCQSSVIPSFREQFGSAFRYEGNRAVLFGVDDPMPHDTVRLPIEHALCYRRRPRQSKDD